MKGRFYTPRESLIPKGAQKVSDKLSDAVAYLYPCVNRGRSFGKPAMMVFYGQQAKPVARYFYNDESAREAAVRKWFDGRREHAKRIAEHAAERKAEVAIVKFEVGKTYYDRSSCDWDTIYSFEIMSRTARQLTIRERGETYKRGIYVYNGVEYCKPHGTYSMCSVIRADKDGTPYLAGDRPAMRWTAQRKIEIIEAAEASPSTLPALLAEHEISIEEFNRWRDLYQRYKARGLRSTKVQQYRYR